MIAIPSKADFSAWTELADAREMRSLEALESALADLSSFSTKSATPHVHRFLRSLRDEREAKWDALVKMPLYQWLLAQPGFSRASQLMSVRRRKRSSPEASQEDRGARLESEADYLLQNHCESATELLTAAQSHCRWGLAQTWHARLIRALEEYLYFDYAPVFESHRNFSKSRSEIENALTRMEPHVSYSAKTKPSAVRELESMRRQLARICERCDEPPQRQLGTHKERMFTKNMYFANRLAAGTYKPEVIAELMTLPCFERQMSQRQIARYCSELEEARKARIQSRNRA